MQSELPCAGERWYSAAMQALPKQKMDAGAFLVWAECQEGRYQLVRGEILAMAPERVAHSDIKRRVANAFEAAIKEKGLKCQAFVDGPGVKIDDETVFEPDALVNCGERVPGGSLIAPNPIIVAEVISPTSERRDLGAKYKNYFRHPSIQHYLLVFIEELIVVHHRRGPEGVLMSAIAGLDGTLTLDPPGIGIAVSALFGEDYAGKEA